MATMKKIPPKRFQQAMDAVIKDSDLGGDRHGGAAHAQDYGGAMTWCTTSTVLGVAAILLGIVGLVMLARMRCAYEAEIAELEECLDGEFSTSPEDIG